MSRWDEKILSSLHEYRARNLNVTRLFIGNNVYQSLLNLSYHFQMRTVKERIEPVFCGIPVTVINEKDYLGYGVEL